MVVGVWVVPYTSSGQKKVAWGGEGGGIFRKAGIFRYFPVKVSLF